MKSSTMRILLWILILAETGQVGKVIVPVTQAQAVSDFSDRIKTYVKLLKNAEASLTNRGSSKDSAEIAAHKIELAAMIVSLRHDARQGDIFTPEIAARLRDTIRETYLKPGGQAVQRTIQDKDPAKSIIVRVNIVYPEESPVQTMPPTLLGRFPDLPADLAYRFVGRALVLLDSKTRLIVDFIPDAIP